MDASDTFAHPPFASPTGLEPVFAEPKSAVLPKLDDGDKLRTQALPHRQRGGAGLLRRRRWSESNRHTQSCSLLPNHSGTAPTRETTPHPHVSAYVSQLARQESNLDLRSQGPLSYQLDDRRNVDTKHYAFHANTRNNSMGKHYCQHHAHLAASTRNRTTQKVDHCH